MSTHCKVINGNYVYWHKRRDKWVDALGPTVRKYFEDFIGPSPLGADNADPLGWTVTVLTGDAGTGTITAANEAGGAVLITVDATENDGVNITHNNEAFLLAAGDPCYFGIRMKLADADQCDLFTGLCITDTEMWGGVSDGIYFNSADAVATCTGLCELNASASTAVGSGTFVDDTYSVLEFFYDGAQKVSFYFDDVLIDTVTAAANIPIDEELTFAFELLTGENVANTATIDWIRIIQCQ